MQLVGYSTESLAAVNQLRTLALLACKSPSEPTAYTAITHMQVSERTNCVY